MAAKHFSQVGVGDTLYYLSPTLLTTEPVTVVQSFQKRTAQGMFQFIKVIRNMQHSNKLITDLEMQRAEDQEGTNIYVDLLLPLHTSSAILQQEVPTVVFTSKEELERWQRQR